MTRYYIVLVAILFALSTAACSPEKTHFINTDLTGNTQFGSDFSLLDSHDQRRSLQDFRGKVVLLFFGYTHCPDVCPSTLAQMREVSDKLGRDADKFQVVFVTLDPERDTAALLAQYMPSFHPRFIGLRPANASELEKVTRDFKVSYNKVVDGQSDTYTIDHFAGSYVFDTHGVLRLFVRYGQETEAVVTDIKSLLS